MTISRNLSVFAEKVDSSGNYTGNTTGTAAGLSATLAIASGGTNSTATPTAGGVGYGTGTAHAYTAAGTSNQILISNAGSAPSWTTLGGAGISEFATGTALLFYQAAAPTGWTKSITNNDKALRVVSGTTGGSAGGTSAFSTVFANQTPSGSVSTSITGVAGSVTVSGGSVGATTLTASQIPAHTHGWSASTGTESANHNHNFTVSGNTDLVTSFNQGATNNNGAATAGNTNGTQIHFSGSGTTGTESAAHTHNVSGTTDNGTGGGTSHTHSYTDASGSFSFTSGTASSSFTGTALTLNVAYCDVIICTKN